MQQIRLCRILALLCFSTLVSCLQKETPIEPYDRGDVIGDTLFYGENYGQQLYYDIETKAVVSKNDKENWDLAVQFDSASTLIYINDARLMQAAVATTSNFAATPDVNTLYFRAGYPSHHPDSIPLKNCLSTDAMYVLDLGFSTIGNPLGYIKAKFQKMADGTIQICYGKLNATVADTLVVENNSQLNVTHVNLQNNQIVLNAPNKKAYDLVFSQYTHQFYEPYTPYLVTGVLINSTGVKVAIDSTSAFKDITSTNIASYVFSSMRDVIGYTWKIYSFDTQSYTVFSNKTYIIKTPEGFYYKLHFVGFYNQFGEKGYPSFEFQLL